MQPLNEFRQTTLLYILLIVLALFLNACSGGGSSSSGPTSISTGVPLVWDQAQATWDHVDWQ